LCCRACPSRRNCCHHQPTRYHYRPHTRRPGYGFRRGLVLIGRAVGRGAFKGAALIGAFVIIIAAWWWDASLLTAAADENLRLIKTVTGALPFNWGSKAESALRLFGADRALLLIEGVAIAKVAMLGIAYFFRRRRQPML
jgi:hypothetical protein